MSFKREQIEVGRRLLKRLLPAAIEAARSSDLRAEASSAIGVALSSHLTMDKIDAVIIHEADLGGWHCDVLLKNMPTGFPNIIGSPVATPYRTRQEAVDAAPMFLSFFAKYALENAQKPPEKANPVFTYFDVSLDLNPLLLKKAHTLKSATIGDDGSYPRDRLEEFTRENFPNGFSVEAFRALPESTLRELTVIIYMAALSGDFRYPQREAATPTGHQGSQTKH